MSDKTAQAIAEFRAAIVADWNRSGETYDKVARRFGLTRSMLRHHLAEARKEGAYVRHGQPARWANGGSRLRLMETDT